MDIKERYIRIMLMLNQLDEIGCVQSNLITDAEYLIEVSYTDKDDTYQKIIKELQAADHIIHQISNEIGDLENYMADLYKFNFPDDDLIYDVTLHKANKYKGVLHDD